MVEVATTRVAFEEVSYLGLLSMVAQLPAAARLLLSARPRVFAIPSMTGSCIKGNEIINVIQQHTGIPTVVPSLEFVNALHALNAPRIALVSIFSVELNILEKLFFATHGIDVRHIIRIEEQIGSEPSQLVPIDYGMYLDIIAGQMPGTKPKPLWLITLFSYWKRNSAASMPNGLAGRFSPPTKFCWMRRCAAWRPAREIRCSGNRF